MNLEQAARQALTFIESLTGMHREVTEERDEISAALREALAQGQVFGYDRGFVGGVEESKVMALREFLKKLQDSYDQYWQTRPVDLSEFDNGYLASHGTAMNALQYLINQVSGNVNIDAVQQVTQPVQREPKCEPVAWHHPECEGSCLACLIEKDVQENFGNQGLAYLQRNINAAPPVVQQENTARCGGCDKTAKEGWALYCVECWEKEQPQGEWVDLTPHEVTEQIREGASDGGWQGFAQRITAKFKSKNTSPVVQQTPIAYVKGALHGFATVSAVDPTMVLPVGMALYRHPAKAQSDCTTAEPFGYFRANMDGWEDCLADDEGAVALYENQNICFKQKNP